MRIDGVGEVDGLLKRASLPMKARVSPHIRLGFLLALGLILASAGVAYRNTRHFMDVSASVAHTHEVRAELAAVLSMLERAETGQRGYIITP